MQCSAVVSVCDATRMGRPGLAWPMDDGRQSEQEQEDEDDESSAILLCTVDTLIAILHIDTPTTTTRIHYGWMDGYGCMMLSASSSPSSSVTNEPTHPPLLLVVVVVVYSKSQSSLPFLMDSRAAISSADTLWILPSSSASLISPTYRVRHTDRQGRVG